MSTMQLHRRLMQKLLVESGSPEMRHGQAMCLRVLAAHDGIAQRDLAERLHLARPTVTTLLQRMEKAGFVTRQVDSRDQRLTRVYLTATGREMEAQLRAAFAEHIRLTFGSLPEADRRELERLLLALSAQAARALLDADPPTTSAVEEAGP